ncbi:MAG: glucose-1-phosphate adenylyltransferase [Acidobacteria bacterium]|nr:glucose-1-phosphate adenylyltransferase [Acidobacteriota bacterium]
MQNALAILLAGGAGERLHPLTRNVAKPAVAFGGYYRIIDFTLSNCVNSGLRRIFCLTQYKSLELARHVREGWNLFSGEMGEFIEVVPPMKRVHEDWYLGTADAVYQNIESIESERPSYVIILAGDHIYKMNYGEMLAWHVAHGAGVTLATIQANPEQGKHFGVVDIDPGSYRVRGFKEKPQHGSPAPSAFDPAMISVSMGVYIFDRSVLLEGLRADAADADSEHDFGKNVLPALLERCYVCAYDFRDLNRKCVRYWRDVGTIDSYYEANMDLVSVSPEFNLYDTAWPIRTRMPQAPPAKFVFAQEGRRMGVATDSIVSPGVIVSGARVHRSVLSPGVRVNSYCNVDSSILLQDVIVGRYSRVSRAIVGEGVHLPEGSVIGEDPVRDRAAGYHVTEGGVTVVCAGGS